jgi:hypothetical protein
MWYWVMSLLGSGFGVAVVITARKEICVVFWVRRLSSSRSEMLVVGWESWEP